MLDWDDLRYFLAIHRGGSFSSAARQLRVDQSTVGRRLAILQEALAARLFVRHANGFRLTPAGEAIVPTAERVEECMRALEHSVSGDDARLEGIVRVTTIEALAQRVVVPGLAGMRVSNH